MFAVLRLLRLKLEEVARKYEDRISSCFYSLIEINEILAPSLILWAVGARTQVFNNKLSRWEEEEEEEEFLLPEGEEEISGGDGGGKSRGQRRRLVNKPVVD